MKNIFALFIIVSACTQNPNIKNHIFSLDIWNYNYSMAYTTHYKIDNDSIIITAVSGVENENNKILINRKITEDEKVILSDFLFSFPLNSLDSIYENPLIDDGDQKRIEINIDQRKKIIEIKNFYQKDIYNLFKIVNNLLDKDLQITYKK